MEGLREAIAWKRGRLAFEVFNIEAMPPERVRTIRKSVAKSVREFEARFGISAATINNREQGRRTPDPSARVLLRIIEAEPEAVRRAMAFAGAGRQVIVGAASQNRIFGARVRVMV